ncbi:asparagine synthase [Microbacterium sp. BWT-B31]|uniref:asparagine synthase n=1 Tax=Microbacterium sp. BWT-B31 TaxID=3232072 RepID=UPI0035270FDA
MRRNAAAIAEGLAIARAAARLAIRNHILVESIAHDEPFSFEREQPFARDALLALADEQDAAAGLMRRQRKKAWGKYSESDGTHDYRDRDTRNLRRRQRQYSGVAKGLRVMADDPEALTALIENARDAAWGDVESNLQRRLRVEGMHPENDPDYERMRGARMQALRLVDLARLSAHQRRRKEAAEPALETE